MRQKIYAVIIIVVRVYSKTKCTYNKVMIKIQIFVLQIYYWDDDSAEPRLMEVPGCTSFCPLQTFLELTKNVMSHNYNEDCDLLPNS